MGGDMGTGRPCTPVSTATTERTNLMTKSRTNHLYDDPRRGRRGRRGRGSVGRISASRLAPNPAGRQTRCLNDLVIDRNRRRATVGETNLWLTTREFDLLARLATDPQRVFSTGELVGDLFGNAPGVTRRTVDSYAARLRRKLELCGMPGMVANCWGVGFRLLDASLTRGVTHIRSEGGMG